MLFLAFFLLSAVTFGYSYDLPDFGGCTAPPNPDNGHFTPTRAGLFQVLDRIWFECDEGYSLVGEQDFTCSADGSWIPHDFPSCVACSKPEAPINGNLEPTQDVYPVGHPVRFTCKEGFVIVGSEFAECLDSGLWSEETPQCIQDVQQCARPDDPENGTIDPEGVPLFIPGEEIGFSCLPEYSLVGTEKFICQDDGNWNSENFPSCIACVPPRSPDNGQFMPPQALYRVGQRVDFKCDRNFNIEGAGWITCLESGQWSDEEPQCVEDQVQCERPEDPENGSIRPPNVDLFNPGQKLWFSCNKPYTLVGKADFRCQDNGEFNSQDFPECVACQPPQTPDNGQLRPVQDLYSIGQRVDFKCDKNFQLQGAGWIKCLNTGLWSDDEPQCVRVEEPRCRKPGEPGNGYIKPRDESSFKPGEKIWFICDQGFSLRGKHKDFKCQRNGSWSPQGFPSCVREAICGRPKEPSNGYIHPRREKSFKPGKKIWFKCDRGYDLNGKHKDFRCQKDGQWSPRGFPTCIRKSSDNKRCGRPKEPSNGYIHPRREKSFKPGKKIWFKCDRGYDLNGKHKDFRCQKDGQWSPRGFPTCIRKSSHNKRCGRPKEPSNGYIHPRREKSFKPGKKIWFKCDRGYDLNGKHKDFRCQKDGQWSPRGFPTCIRKSSHRTVIACERTYRSSARCRRGYKIKVVSGFYGRDNSRTCTKHPVKTTRCFAKGSEDKLKKLCHNKSHCRIKPTNQIFGDPCHGVYKYVKLVYSCVRH